MLRYAVALVLGVAIATLTNVAVSNAADEKKAETKTLEGKLVCTKCTLSETKACGTALQVKEGDKTVTYYITPDKGGKEPFHGKICPAGSELDAKVTGKVVEKDKKKTITDAKVVIKK